MKTAVAQVPDTLGQALNLICTKPGWYLLSSGGDQRGQAVGLVSTEHS
jgi:hypothetical protein